MRPSGDEGVLNASASRQTLVDFGNRGGNLLLANRVRRRRALSFARGLRVSQRLFRAAAVGGGWWRAGAPLALGLPLLHLFLNARVGVYQPFSGITHKRCQYLESRQAGRPALHVGAELRPSTLP